MMCICCSHGYRDEGGANRIVVVFLMGCGDLGDWMDGISGELLNFAVQLE